MNMRTAKLFLSVLTFLVLLVPTIAPAFSPKFRSVMSAIINNPNTQSAQLEILRLTTPVLAVSNSLYGTALFELGVSPNPNQMVMGKEGYMFLGNDHYHAYDQITHRLDLPEQQIVDWVNALQSENEYLAGLGIPMLFVVAPSTGTIYSDKIAGVPDGLLKNPSILDRVLRKAKERNLPLIDVRSET